jgi:hypothetical protein|tara:strand:- start:1729 stop:1902 length:174 start_codon:yes stop_codon:yes gene_type:complete
MLSHTNLGNYYQTIFAMVQHHKYSISDVEGLLPYERDLYFGMLLDFIEKQNEAQKNQ